VKRVALRPTVEADFVALQGKPPLFRCRCLTAVVDGRVIGIGGIVHAPDGTVWASVLMAAEAQRYPVAIHRAGRAAIAMFRQLGLRRVLAAAERNNLKAERWLRRLGFRETALGGQRVFVWDQE
jgi:RimJ/RimL family protein N-acetyltransferase